MHDLIADGNSIVLVDHDTEILRDADWLIEMGPGAGENGGTILTQGTVEQVAQSPASRIGPFLADLHTLSARTRTPEAELFALGTITLRTRAIHTVKPLEVRLPKGRLIAVTGVSGSGKSSLALGVLYAEGSRRYLEALSTYTRRRMTQAEKAQVDEIRYVPAALALHQRPGVPGMRSTFGTMTELLNSLRLMFSRLSHYPCPSCGCMVPPSLNIAAEIPLYCPRCGAQVPVLGAEQFAFNSTGACPDCEGTGIVRVVDESTLVPDESLSINEGAVLPWQTLMWSLMKEIAEKMGVRTNVPFRELTPEERDMVFHGPAKKVHLLYQNSKTGAAGEMDFTYFNAVYTVENALSKVKDENGMKLSLIHI